MTVAPTPPTPAPLAARRPAQTPEDAARQFEAVLVRQFVDTMTKDLFKASDAAGMPAGQADLQRDTLAEVLTERLVDDGTFGIAELMLRQWRRDGRAPEAAPEAAAAAAPAAPVRADETAPAPSGPAAGFDHPPDLP